MPSKIYFEREITKKGVHPKDIIKLCYQASFGSEHLITDYDKAKKYFFDEYEMTPESGCPICEMISDDFARINIGAWKAKGLCPDYLFSLFVMKSDILCKGEEGFYKYVEIARSLLDIKKREEFDRYFNDYIKDGIRAVSHSEGYKKANHPAYRLVDVRKARIIPILEKISNMTSERCIIAIDGRAASGKTTLAEILASLLGASLIRMDDFFLPKELRTSQRYGMAGGNIHYERFKDEVVDGLISNKDFYYGKFDCSVMNVTEQVKVKRSKYTVIEGVYSHHPYFGEYADVRVFLDIDREAQRERIVKRNGREMAERFESLWIPLEENYYEEFKIKEMSDVII